MRISDWSSDVCSSDLLWIDCELYVGTACFHADFAQDRDARVPHDLIFLVGERQRRRNGDAVTRVDAHRIDVLDRADDDGIVVPVADDLHLIFLPAEERLLDQHLGGGRGIKPPGHDADEILLAIGEHTSELQSLMRNSYAVFCL